MASGETVNRLVVKGEMITDKPLIVKNVTAWWSNTEKVLNGIDMTLDRGKLYGIIGPVGAGKSSLFNLILRELPAKSGSVTINGTVSYASQEPWLFAGNVRQNILFGEEYVRLKYRKVIQSCALSTDFDQLTYGDKTHVGENGFLLSGGQRARVSLARAIYKTSSIYLLDDPLSAVDARVGKHLFDEVIGPDGYLAKQGATRILITHQVHLLKDADFIFIMADGVIIEKGTYDELCNSDMDFARIFKSASKIEIEKDTGTDAPYDLIKTVSNSDYTDEMPPEYQGTQSQSFKLCRRYFSSIDNNLLLICLFAILIVTQLVISGSDFFLSFWTNQEYLRMHHKKTKMPTNKCVLIYGIFILFIVFLVLLRALVFINVCMKASISLHNKMFASLIKAPIRFFDTNSTGRILNRFSKDIGVIDEQLPKVILDAIVILLLMIGILVIISIMNVIMIIFIFFAGIFFAIFIMIYLKPSQDLRRIEGICRSPLFNYLSTTFLGLPTIRARKLDAQLIREFDELQNVHSATWQLSFAALSTFCLWLDIVCTVFVIALIFVFIAMLDDIPSGDVGLAISQALYLTGLVQYGIRQTTETMLQMTYVERILQYADIKEEYNPVIEPPENWPESGDIEIKEMSLRYGENEPKILININVEIKSGWKVGVVGRTGAGKSSLINALFRLFYVEGEIIINNIDTGSISLNSLRSRISIIPQEPVLFNSTIRANLDPFEVYDDDTIWQALHYVELSHSIKSLDFMVTESGHNFSIGQRQLICLARAILRKNKILMLDEATANVDFNTDALIQRTIRHRFADCTVLTIAHRLMTVIDSDRILVMNEGQAAEFDFPHLLLQNPDGIFRSIVDATGQKESALLKDVAKLNYEKLNSSQTSSWRWYFTW